MSRSLIEAASKVNELVAARAAAEKLGVPDFQSMPIADLVTAIRMRRPALASALSEHSSSYAKWFEFKVEIIDSEEQGRQIDQSETAKLVELETALQAAKQNFYHELDRQQYS